MPLCVCSLGLIANKCKGERTAGVFPPRDVNELLDVADLLGLYRACYELDRKRVERPEGAYHGVERILCPDRGLLLTCQRQPPLLWLMSCIAELGKCRSYLILSSYLLRLRLIRFILLARIIPFKSQNFSVHTSLSDADVAKPYCLPFCVDTSPSFGEYHSRINFDWNHCLWGCPMTLCMKLGQHQN